MKSLIWDYETKTLIDCQELKLDINMNPQIAFGINIHRVSSDFCQLEFIIDYSYFGWIQEWLDTANSINRKRKRDLHLNNDIIFIGCLPKLINLNPQDGNIELIIMCDHYRSEPFRQILEVHRDLMINEILSN